MINDIINTRQSAVVEAQRKLDEAVKQRDELIAKFIAPVLTEFSTSDEERYCSERELIEDALTKFFLTQRGALVLAAIEILREALPFIGYGASVDELKERANAISDALLGPANPPMPSGE